jgi:Zn-dependent protease with chaperone function
MISAVWIIPIIFTMFSNLPFLFKSVLVLGITIAIRTLYYSGNVFVDNKYYINSNHTEDEREVVGNIISVLQKQANALVTHVQHEYPTDARASRLVGKWKDNSIHEMEHATKDIFAYNVNKGENIFVCVHDEHNKLNTLNELFFVVMHEMAHIMTRDFEHNDEFWESFRLLIRTATKRKLFQNINYGEKPTYFCGHHIDHNPTFDK